ncbi:helix-hairpin-helix domain-containing protein [Bradymonas sediminis]|uniref:Uncharacterized protein n=1 Tax=Bradymonas sediminis TaxID=1548548 RepID=A0A2Z4FKM6_9DELT|nr:helix-hairpin-helix domain-containing protein [Bradymonas sediminis]AWV89380.1 hypothetical protein DN745_08540 [Bradymonas sediminis]TDP73561.1 matrixin [Bradymonas sediminis]
MLRRKLILLSCSALFILSACGDDTPTTDATNEVNNPSGPGGKGDHWVNTGEPVSYEDFRAQVYCEPDHDICVTEGDIPIAGGEAGIQAFYYERIRASQSALSVNQSGGEDTLYTRARRLDLSYCVDDAFGEDKALVITAMREAAEAWEAHGHLKFRYDASQDADCGMDLNAAVFFTVTTSPADAGYLARAFFPDSQAADRQVRVNVPSFAAAGDGDDDFAKNLTMAGILRHELGHVLGFRHEHTRPEANDYWCFEDDNYRPVTEYDSASVMHYPQCSGTGDWSLVLTDIDVQGVAFFYPDFERYPMGRCDVELSDEGDVLEDCAPVAHHIVEFVNNASEDTLDHWAGLDTRAVDDILATRSRSPFHTLEDLKQMHYLKEHGVRKLYDYLYVDGRCAAETDANGLPLASCWPVSHRILEFANTASLEELDVAARLDRRAAENIVAARQNHPFESLSELWLINYVKTNALNKLYNHLYD